MRLAIDAGHWINEPGRRCMKQFDPGEHREWWLNSRIVEKVIAILTDYDVAVIRTDDPTGNTLVPLDVRRNKADDFGADLLLSVHHNGAIKGGSGGGTVTYTDDSKKNTVSFLYAKALYNEVVSKTGLIGNRRAKVTTKSLAVCRSQCPAILIENGFMDSSTDVPIIITEDHADKTAAGIVAFLVNTFGIRKIGGIKTDPVCYVGRVIAQDGLNLRRDPGNGGQIITELLDKSFVLILADRSDGWSKVKTPEGVEGYVYRKYLFPYVETDFNRKRVTDPTGLNIRSGAGVSNTLLATMPYDAGFMILQSGTWGIVWCGDSIGWANLSNAYSEPLK